MLSRRVGRLAVVQHLGPVVVYQQHRCPEIRAYRDASTVRSYSLVGRLLSRDLLVFSPSKSRS